jgi:hypothetical protein
VGEKRDAEAAGDEAEDGMQLVDLLHDVRLDAGALERAAELALDVARLDARRRDQRLIAQRLQPDRRLGGQRMPGGDGDHIGLPAQQQFLQVLVVEDGPQQADLDPARPQRFHLLVRDHLVQDQLHARMAARVGRREHRQHIQRRRVGEADGQAADMAGGRAARHLLGEVHLAQDQGRLVEEALARVRQRRAAARALEQRHAEALLQAGDLLAAPSFSAIRRRREQIFAEEG